MKNRYWITALCFLALSVSVCAKTAPVADKGETSPWYYDQPTVAEDAYLADNGIVVGPFTFRYTGVKYSERLTNLGYESVIGLTLYSCEEGVEEAVIPSEVGGIPVIAIGGSDYYEAGYYHVFGENSVLRSVVIPDSVLFIGGEAFYGCTNLTDVTLSKGLQSIGEKAFYGCTSLTSIDFPRSLETIEEYAFSFTNLEQITLTANMEVEEYAFLDIANLKKVIVEEGVTEIPSFVNCVNLTEINIPEGVYSIHSFSGCTSLTELDLPSTITRFGITKHIPGRYLDVLAGTKVTFLDIPEGPYFTENGVFANSSLISVVLPASLRSVGDDIFENCPIETIYFRGTQDQCPQDLKDQATAAGATIYYYSETRPSGTGNYWRYVSGKPAVWLWTWG